MIIQQSGSFIDSMALATMECLLVVKLSDPSISQNPLNLPDRVLLLQIQTSCFSTAYQLFHSNNFASFQSAALQHSFSFCAVVNQCQLLLQLFTHAMVTHSVINIAFLSSYSKIILISLMFLTLFNILSCLAPFVCNLVSMIVSTASTSSISFVSPIPKELTKQSQSVSSSSSSSIFLHLRQDPTVPELYIQCCNYLPLKITW